MQLEITILNWEKYNFKRKNGHNPWFKLYNDIPRSKSLHGLSTVPKWLFICLLCECSRQSRAKVEVSLSWCSLESEIKPSKVREALELLSSRSILSWVSKDSCAQDVLLECRLKNKNKKESKREKIKIEEVLPVKKEEQSLAFARDSTNLLIRAYCDAFKLKYKTNPPIDGKTVGLAKNLLKHISLERAQNLIQVYLQMEDSWFKNKHHDFVTFTQNLNKIQVAMNNGKETKEGDIDWDKFWKDVGEKEVSDGTRSLPNPNKTT